MAKNCVIPGRRAALSLPVASGTRSGSPVVVGDIVGVAETDRTETVSSVDYGAPGNPAGYATVNVDGVYEVSTTDAVSAVGTKIYITSAYALTTTASGNTLFGRTVPVFQRGVAVGATKASGAGTVYVAINPTV